MGILMLIGMALIPRLDFADQPRPRQGKTLTISFTWQGASAKVIEQNVTSRIEGLVSSVKGVKSVESVSQYGSGNVTIHLKKDASVSSVKFEIGSLLRQVRDRFPEGVSYPILSGGEVITSESGLETHRPLLTYLIQANMQGRDIRRDVERILKPQIEQEDGVSRIEVTGGTDYYLQISYDAQLLSLYGVTVSDIEEAIRIHMGRKDIVGEVIHLDKSDQPARTSIFLGTDTMDFHIESFPVKTIDGKIIYLNNLATCEWKEQNPDRYYRVNGMNTIYLNVYAKEDANISKVANKVKEVIAEHIKPSATNIQYTLTYDRAEEQMSEFYTLVIRSGISILFLLLVVYLSKRSWKYLCIIATTLLANILIAVPIYWLLDLRLHPFSMAGITVSFGLIIDSTIVMVDHYSYTRNFGAFYGILGAMLTTIGSLLIIIWLPEFLKIVMYDFSWIIIINLAIGLLVALLFVPALVCRLNYSSRQRGIPQHLQFVRGWTLFYSKYVYISQHRIWRWMLLLIMAGMFIGSLMLFTDTFDRNTYQPAPTETKLYIRGQMPLGGSVQQMNEKVEMIEAFLSQFEEIKHFETQVTSNGASIIVEFKSEALNTGFPYLLENKVIGRLITIGGADWSTHGVSKRGFSNSLNLQHRANSIEIAGYDYDRLYRFAEDICRKLRTNNRVSDITIETPGHENQNDELYAEYNRQQLMLYGTKVTDIYASLSSMFSEHKLTNVTNNGKKLDIILTPKQNENFDLWQLDNSYIKVANQDVKVSDLMSIRHREGKNIIPRENQEYILRVAFNVLGSYEYTSKYIEQVTDEFNSMFPIGFRCINKSYGGYHDSGMQYWLIGLVAVIIFFICAILFESLHKAFVIIMLIPYSLTGLFLTYYFSGVEFGTGGFAAMCLTCGLSVNAGIYLMNEYNQNRNKFVKAYNHKIIPILLTVASTIVGLIPFLIDGDSDNFWYSFSVGSMGGMLTSVPAMILVMPLLIYQKDSKCKKIVVYS